MSRHSRRQQRDPSNGEPDLVPLSQVNALVKSVEGKLNRQISDLAHQLDQQQANIDSIFQEYDQEIHTLKETLASTRAELVVLQEEQEEDNRAPSPLPCLTRCQVAPGAQPNGVGEHDKCTCCKFCTQLQQDIKELWELYEKSFIEAADDRMNLWTMVKRTTTQVDENSHLISGDRDIKGFARARGFSGCTTGDHISAVYCCFNMNALVGFCYANRYELS